MDGGISLRSAQRSWELLQVGAMDTALVAIGAPDILPDIRGPATPEDGLSFNLLNNAWGTNYIMWTPYGPGIGSDIKSRCCTSHLNDCPALIRGRTLLCIVLLPWFACVSC